MRARLLGLPFSWILLSVGCGDSLPVRPGLSVDPLPASTTSVVVTLTGKAPARALVRVEGGAAPAQAMAADDGTFRAVVALRVGAHNRLQVTPEQGGLGGRSVGLDIEQRVPASWTAAREVPPPAAPLLDPLPSVVGSTAAPIAGLAEPGITVTVRDPYQIQRITADPASGRFATVVRLRPSSLSSVVVNAVDAQGNTSEAAVVNLTHDPSLATATPVPLQRPMLEALPAQTPATCITVTGQAAPLAHIRITGGESPAEGVTGPDGRFAVGVALNVSAMNPLEVRAVDDAGRQSDPVQVQLDQTGAPQGARYPIVFAHGMGGFDKLLGIYPYWWGVRGALVDDGNEVLMDEVASVQSIEHRAAQLRDEINRLTSGKVNLIGHSAGGLDARYLVAQLGFGDRVASVTTIGTPHHGSTLAELAVTAFSPDAFAAADLLLNLAGWSLTGVREMSVSYMGSVFNATVANDPRVRYFSYAGRADPLATSGHLLAPYFIPTWSVLDLAEGDNDGLVSVRSAQWGEYQGTIPADHMDEVGQLFGITGNFDHLAFYRQIAANLKAQGF
jgi:triacylglycerol esterase/lipase EstA (alpha/beta hydrolase family)